MQETQETWIGSLHQEDTLEQKMATHSSVPAWETPWTEKPGGLQSMRLQRSQTRLSERVHRLSAWGRRITSFQSFSVVFSVILIPFCLKCPLTCPALHYHALICFCHLPSFFRETLQPKLSRAGTLHSDHLNLTRGSTMQRVLSHVLFFLLVSTWMTFKIIRLYQII